MAKTEEDRKLAFASVEAKFGSERDVREVILSHAGGELYFVMTSPTRDEWRMYRTNAKKADDEIAKADVIERAALAQIRYPDREECLRLFNRLPALSINFVEALNQLSGLSAEYEAKK